MIIWNGKDILAVIILSAFLVVIIGALLVDRICFWLEKKNIISSKWRNR